MLPIIKINLGFILIYMVVQSNLYGQPEAVIDEEYIFDTAPFESCHASTLAETPSGLVTAWFGGTHEKHDDVEIWMSRKINGRWTSPYSVASGIYEGKKYPCWNPVLYQVPEKELILFYKVGPDPENWWGMVRRSADDGKTWSDGIRLPEPYIGPVKNKPELIAGGRLLCPSSKEKGGWTAHMEISQDFGQSWDKYIPVDHDSEYEVIQPAILIHENRKVQILCRSKQGFVITAWSEDGGLSWSALQPTDLPNPNSGIDAVTLKNGMHVLVYNHSTKSPQEWGGPRYPLNVAVSHDDTTWNASLVLEDQPGEYSYPAVIQSTDGLIHITYTWKRSKIKHVVLDPDKLPEKPLRDWDNR